MLNSYDTPDFRETIEYKGNLTYKHNKIELHFIENLETLIQPDHSIIIRCQQIFLFLQLIQYLILQICYLVIPKVIIIESPLIYIFSWSILLVQSFQINLSPNTVKRYPINIFIFCLGSVSRIFVILFIFEYFDVSKYLLLNLIILSIVNYVQFKTIQQNYQTYLDTNIDQNEIQTENENYTIEKEQPDKDWELLMSRQEDDFKDQENSDDENENKDSEQSQEQSQQSEKQIEQIEQQIKENHQNQIENKKQIPNNVFFIWKIYFVTLIYGIIIPTLLWQLFKFNIKQLIIVSIFNIIYLLIIYYHCKSYQSQKRIITFIYNIENAYFLLLSFFDSDILCPWWLINELWELRDQNSARKTRISFY